jgi:hypothetical protein
VLPRKQRLQYARSLAMLMAASGISAPQLLHARTMPFAKVCNAARSLSHVEGNSLTRHNIGALLRFDLAERLSF